ncbi:MAG TPA: EamA family transporter [Candidatus Acidoferrum sp.]|jgi:drug/metabolite transporter (DMT)-like permease
MTKTENQPSDSLNSNPGTAHAGAHGTANSTALLAAFAAIYLVWGSTFLAIRIGDESFPPLLVAGIRHSVFGLIFFPIMLWKTKTRPTWAEWRTAAITGFLLLAIGNGGVCLAEERVPSGVAALLVATVSLWMVLIDWLRPGGVRPVPRVIVGLIFGFAGLALLVGPKDLGGSGRIDPIGVVILGVGSFAWACGSIYSKHGQMPSSPLLGASMQGLVGGIILWIAAGLTGEIGALHVTTVSTRSWVAVVYLVCFGSMIGFSSYIYLLKHSTATRVATYAFVNPLVALFLGWLFLHEAITLRTILAGAVILAAVLLVITAPHRATSKAAITARTKVIEATEDPAF